ncbi:MAG: autotransporter-associated beta strand repeat-containing protein [Verrucomicrobiae bacterium]|nr:autotransporter-associated beta strand repeat-containing protein [Verrucomicrobiae bacterium]
MKTFNLIITPCVCAALLIESSSLHAAIYQWKGTTSSDWTNVNNWATGPGGTGIKTGPGDTNGVFNNRLNVTNNLSAGFEMVYDASLGNTTYGNTTNGSPARGLVVGSSTPGRMHITGGTFSTVGSTGGADIIGNGAGVTGTLIVDGGAYISGTLGTALGIGSGGYCSLIVSNGAATMTTLTYNPGTGSALVSLNGGTLTVNSIIRSSGGTNFLNFNGGVLKAGGSSTTFWPATLSRANVQNGGAIIDTGGFNITIAQSLQHSTNAGDNAIDGGLTKNGSGTLTLSGANTSYTGPTVVSAGTLIEPFQQSSSSLIVKSGATNVILTASNVWNMASAALTNATLGFNYGSWNINAYTNANLNITNLTLAGTVTINVSGTGFPVTNLTLLTYGSKTGGGVFALGTLPSGAAATLTDTGSALVLNITTGSVQSLVWSGGDGNWQTNGGLDWNNGTATYLEYPSGSGDAVAFNDTLSTGGQVQIPGTVKPISITVSGTTSTYSFVGNGSISGAATLSMAGANSVFIYTSNSFSGPVTMNGTGGIIYVANACALGATNGGVTAAGANSIEIGDGFLPVTVSSKSITISGSGFGGALGTLRGSYPSSSVGNNVWAGPVIIGANDARIGTEINGNLTVSGPITDNGAGYELFFRPASAGFLTISGTNNSYGNTVIFESTGTGGLMLGANNALSRNQLGMGPGIFDLNGFNQSSQGITDNSPPSRGTIYNNNGASISTLTVNAPATFATSATIGGGAGQLNFVKTGSGTQRFNVASPYTGTTLVNGGELDVVLPMSSSGLSLASGTTIGITVSNSSWSPTFMNVTNATMNLNYGSQAPAVLFTASTLNVSGGNIINIAGTNLPVGHLTLIAYGSKNGGGTFTLGTLPANVQASITDTGSAIVLNVNFSPQSLTWYGAVTGSWNTNATLDWNQGAAYYQQYTNGLSDLVTFDDTASAFAVVISNNVHPFALTVNNNTNAYTIGGPGQIIGTNSLVKNGTNILFLTSSNIFSGGTMINAGTVSFADGALSRVGNITINAGATLQWGASNVQDVASQILIGGSSTTSSAILDVGSNNVVFNSGLGQAGGTGSILNQVAKIGSGTLTLNQGTNYLSSVVRINAGTLVVNSGATMNVDGAGNPANAALACDQSAILVNGGTINVLDRLGIGGANNSTGMVSVVSGSLNVETGTTSSDRGVRLTGGTVAGTSNSMAVLNLNGGALTTAIVYQGLGASNTSIFNFNGGTLKPSANVSGSNFMVGLTHAYVKVGGAVVDTATDSLVIGQALENDGVSYTDGGLVKLGSGLLALTAANGYTGPTIISNGTLWVSGAIGTNTVTTVSGATLGSTGVISGPVTIRTGGILMPGTSTASNEVLTINNSLQLAGTAWVQIGKSSSGTPVNDSVMIGGNITYGGTLIVTNADNSALAAGDVFQLFSASGSKSGNFASVQLVPPVSGVTASFNPTTGQLTLSSNPGQPYLTNNVIGTSLQLSWSGGGKLQVQTNSLNVGLSTNWRDYPGGGSSPVTVPIDKLQGCLFFRVAQ